MDVAGEFVNIHLCNQKQFSQLKRGAKASAESEGKKEVSEVGGEKCEITTQGEKKIERIRNHSRIAWQYFGEGPSISVNCLRKIWK